MRTVEHLIVDLESLRGGCLSNEEFRLRHPIVRGSDELYEIHCNLEHYLSDRDIRERDPGYRRFQEDELSKLIDHLRSGNLGRAARVTFLERSGA